MTITEFLLARIAEDEAAARDVPPLGHNFDMGGHRQDERWIFGRTLPSSADGVGNWSEHRDSPATATHFARHDPARVLAECEAKRRIVELHPIYRGPRLLAVDSTGRDFACEKCHAASSIDDQSVIEALGPCNTLLALASVYVDHPDYRDEWRQ